MELAHLGGGEVAGIDIDAEALGKFEKRIEEEGLGAKVKAIHGSMLDMTFPPESFDIVWAEGSLHIVGLSKGLSAIRRFIRPVGFLVMHESIWIRPDPPENIRNRWESRYPDIRTVDGYKEWVTQYGYSMIASFVLPEDFWWNLYYEPLGRRIEEFREKHSDNPETLAILDREQQEVDLFERSSQWFGSAYLVLQRVDR